MNAYFLIPSCLTIIVIGFIHYLNTSQDRKLLECAKAHNVYECEWVAVPKINKEKTK